MRFFKTILARLGLTSLTRRIVVLNLAGLVALVGGILYLSQFRAGIIDARTQSLLVQGEIIAAAIAASAQNDTGEIALDPEALTALQSGDTLTPAEDPLAALEFPINPERVAPVLRRLVTPTKTRARLYDKDGTLILDSRSLYGRGDVVSFDLPPLRDPPNFVEKNWIKLKRWFAQGDLPLYRDLGPSNGRGYPEVAQSLTGQKASMVRANERGEVVVSVSVPVQRFRAVAGVLLLSTQGADIDAIVEAERFAILQVFLVACAVMGLVSFFLAGTIAGPVRKLADAAESVRRRIKGRVEIPDFTERLDEIGHLSGALRDMTSSLYSRIEAIERFAADVAHELKNPLTSLRSAVETLPLAKSEDSRERLRSIIQHDVKRLDRLITDISEASRLDAELQRQSGSPVDLFKLLTTVVAIENDMRAEPSVPVVLSFKGAPPFRVSGHDSRLAQVIHNLIDNARSFSLSDGSVRVQCIKHPKTLEILVDDDGPGIRVDAFDKIFQRFYTDRPHQGFGQNSGLGLSICRQIVEAHGGAIRAENRLDAGGAVLGARFIVTLPKL